MTELLILVDMVDDNDRVLLLAAAVLRRHTLDSSVSQVSVQLVL